MMEQKHNRVFAVILVFTAIFVCMPVQAGLLKNILTQTGLLDVVTPVTSAVGIDLDDTVTALDGVVSEVLGGVGDGVLDGGIAELSLTDQESTDLLAMDIPVVSVVDNIVDAVFTPTSPADDQPALIPLVNLDPVFVVGQIQSQPYQCTDADRDGVCDQDDQCLETPPGKKVLANGCYLDGPRGLTLEGVWFANDSHQLNPAAQEILTTVADMIKQSSATLIEVGGYTDNAGDAEYNLQLSVSRAASVRDYLVQLGIARSRLQVKGYGEASPRADNSRAEGRAMNRRVELKVIERQTF
ncbi:Outer membrane porin F [Zhongshania aliphaticivorans]|uniref:Outer membrane porin F n=1 Tax=Zhongshania aliphaticivorans TaxID=1470434 RepID=A0A5S9MSB8_9GAMM|nr:OmpA family protein [Zhongshania aliphaticivorans]CAA0079073.1 Outer membrane porin F [Zhongshania aliphaticivorans]CAA0086377.1 Outer membrane porin F [Zhongshania aliphaticivorans]